MRKVGPAVLLALVSSIPLQPALAQSDSAKPVTNSHPPDVAFVDEGTKGSVYRQTEHSLRLYVSDRDGDGRSNCNGSCASAWPPLRPSANAESVGEWTIIQRDDGTRQWAFRNKPVYTRFHDSPDQPTGDGIQGVWHLLPYMTPQPNP